MGFDAPSHWLILAAVAILLFGGYKKLPEMSRSMGRSLRIFKTEMKGLDDDNAARRSEAEAAADSVAPVVAPVVVPPVVPPVVNGTPVSSPVATPNSEPAPPVQQTSSQLGV